MWMVDPKLLCKKHLLGEHGEIHKHRHNFLKKHRVTKRISPVVQIEPQSMETRHNELAMEMLRRGYNHQSSFEQLDISYLPVKEKSAVVDTNHSLFDLSHRCVECFNNINVKINP